MELKLLTVNGQQIAEGTPGRLLLGSAAAVDEALEFCFAHRVRLVLLHSDNLADDFFELRSGMIVLAPTRELSDRFRQLIAEENQGPYIRFFDDREAAHGWLTGSMTINVAP